MKDSKLKKRMLKLLDRFAERFSESGITKKDVKKEIASARER